MADPGAFPSAVNGGCDVKPQGEAGGCAAYWARGDEDPVLLDPSRPEVARLIVVDGASTARGRSSLMVAPHEPTSEACEPTCSPIRPALPRELSTDMAVKGKYAVPAQS